MAGSELSTSKVSKLTVPKLKDHLKRYGITTTGYRKDVLLRLASCVTDLGLEEDPDRIHEDAIKDVERTLQNLECNFTDPFSLAGYTPDLSLIPDFGLYDIFNYLLCHRAEYDRKKLKGYKSFEDYRLFTDGHVMDLMYNHISDVSSLCIFMARVKPTQKDQTYLKKPLYDLWFILAKNTGEIKAAYCQCLGGADGACRHVAAALYALEALEKTSVTDGPCQWQKRPMAHDHPVPVKQLCIQTTRYGVDKDKQADQDDFDPRHPEDRTPLSHSQQQEFARGVFEVIFPSASALKLLLGPEELSVTGLEQKPNPECVRLSMKSKVSNFLQSVEEATSPKQLGSEFLGRLSYTQEKIDFIQRETVGQHGNPTWHIMREGMIAASKFKRVSSRVKTLIEDSTTDPTKTVDYILGTGPAIPDDLEPLKWGKKKESVARAIFMKVERKRHTRLKIDIPGLQLYAPKSFIGCSADGVLSCSCNERHPTKLAEIKCSHALKRKSPKVAAKEKGCNCVNGVWEISKDSEYYAQIQGQLGIYGLNMCDLIIYTTQGIQVIPVCFDSVYFKDMKLRLDFFYQHCVLPTLMSAV